MTLKRYKNKVGKHVAGSIYLHRDYVGELFPELADKINSITDVKFNLLKIPKRDSVREKYISLVHCTEFNYANEPRVGVIYRYEFGKGIVKQRDYSSYVYHHKWLWVKDDYNGFDVQEQKDRSEMYKKLNPPSNRIGSYRVWKNWLEGHGIPL